MRITAYALIAAGGIVLAAVVDELAALLHIKDWLWWLMCAWLIVGGLSSLAGAVARRWVGEFVGLPLAGAALLGFALLQGRVNQWSVFSIPSVALLGAFGLLLLSRWRDVVTLYRAAIRGDQS